VTASGYKTVDVAATYDLNANLALFARVNNLLNKTYENPDGFLQPAIGAFAGITVKF
jgi:vitamin B12 transporter